MGHYLAEQGRDFVVLEAADRPAATWRDRWDSLVLFTPVRRDSLPGKPFPATRTTIRRATRSSAISRITLAICRLSSTAE